MNWNDRILGAVFLLALSVALGWIQHAHSSPRIPLTQPYQARYARPMKLENALAAWKGGSQFLDARRAKEFAEGHIQGAWNIPPTIQHLPPELVAQLEKKPRIVIYCDGADCGSSKKLARKLVSLGLTRVWIMPDGYGAWVKAGHPYE